MRIVTNFFCIFILFGFIFLLTVLTILSSVLSAILIQLINEWMNNEWLKGLWMGMSFELPRKGPGPSTHSSSSVATYKIVSRPKFRFFSRHHFLQNVNRLWRNVSYVNYITKDTRGTILTAIWAFPAKKKLRLCNAPQHLITNLG